MRIILRQMDPNKVRELLDKLDARHPQMKLRNVFEESILRLIEHEQMKLVQISLCIGFNDKTRYN